VNSITFLDHSLTTGGHHSIADVTVCPGPAVTQSEPSIGCSAEP
jgi:hypothetical protein